MRFWIPGGEDKCDECPHQMQFTKSGKLLCQIWGDKAMAVCPPCLYGTANKEEE